MSGPHFIKRQVLDITLDSNTGSVSFQNQLSRFFHERVLPIIDSAFDDLDHFGETIRIDRLEIELGKLSRKNFEVEFLQAVSRLLPSALAEAVRYEQPPLGESQSPGAGRERVDRDFRLLEFYLKNGSLPWWVPQGEIYDMSVLLRNQMKRFPEQISALAVDLKENHYAVKRLLHHAGESVFDKIVKNVFSPNGEAILKLKKTLEKKIPAIELFNGMEKKRIREVIRYIILQEAYSFPSVNMEELTLRIIVHIIDGLADRFNLNARDIHNSLTPLLLVEGYKLNQYKTEKKWEETGDSPGENERVTSRNSSSANYIKTMERQVEILERILVLITPPVLPDLQKTGDKISPEEFISPVSRLVELNKEILVILEEIKTLEEKSMNTPAENEAIMKKNADARQLSAQINKITRSISSGMKASSRALTESLNPGKKKAGKEIFKLISVLEKETPGLPEKAGGSQQRIISLDPVNPGEDIYIFNAGLVILWPYLPHFFKLLGLIENDLFTGPRASARAVFLLHYLVAPGEVAYADYQQGLAKVICGLDPGELVESSTGVTADEALECDNLLKGVILNWNVLKNMPVEGLRQLFLSREGVIRYREDSFFLQVQSQACDVLLNRIPWGIGTVKLPWMKKVLFVEWSV